ncbi:MAG: KpsF/GutQ family sugar-phosphate isomerase [Pirellulales bacterium]|nr:KpsF/GutQ family sugar-phosphate isomerase [Pirellulales bacterium]
MSHSPSFPPLERLQFARGILRDYAGQLEQMAAAINAEFLEAAQRVFDCRGHVVVSGMGKAGYIGRKVSATLASTGTPSHFLHPAEAVHGDLGRLTAEDVVIMFSQSGETEEVIRLLPALREMGVPVLAVTGNPHSTLGVSAAVTLALGKVTEACDLNLAPSTSTMAMLALGDALALVVSKMRGFREIDFARFHPGGSLGLKLSSVQDHMRPLAQCRIADESFTVRQILIAQGNPGRRTGAIMLHDSSDRLTGLFTDSDLARLFERHSEARLDGPVRDVMTVSPLTVEVDSRMTEAVAIMAQRKISELPVVDPQGCPRGLIDITDVVSAFPQLAEANGPHSQSDGQDSQMARPA